MATTWMKALHRGGGSIAAALDRSVDYVENPDKTNDGELIEGFECEPFTAQSEFLLSKRLYEQKTGRDQGRHDVIAYHIRMSFKPDEVTAQEALELGRELAMRWTRGKHQFIVAAHTNTDNPHTHIIFNAVNLNCTGKYNDFKHSAIALRRVSDRICLEHGLSVIEKPGLSKGYNRNEYLGGGKVPSARGKLRALMDEALSACKDFDDFLAALAAEGVEIKRGKQLAFKIPGGEKFIRCKSLGEQYTEDAILKRLLGGTLIVASASKPSLLIDIQAKMQQGYGAGFEHYAKLRNLKEMAKTLIYLQENGLDDYAVLKEKTAEATSRFNDLNDKIKAADNRMNEIAALQKHIGNYSKTRDVYIQYRQSGYSQRFHDAHAADIILHQAAKKHFDSLGLKKLPSMQSLRQEYAVLAAEKKKHYNEYRQTKDEMRELLTAKSNVDRVLNLPNQTHDQRKNDAPSL